MIADTPGKTTRAGDIQRLVNWVMETEHQYLMHGPRHDPVVLPWMPYQPADFISIMWDVVAEIDGPVFLDVGCGPGTKMRIARDMFGLSPMGIEIDREMAAQADAHGLTYPADALNLPSVERLYAIPDVIWLYRPFRDPESEAKLEHLITENMKPGAILAGGAWEMEPPAGWQTIVDDWQVRRGAWQKPR